MASHGVNTTVQRVSPPAVPKPKFKLALCQLAVTSDKEKNIASARAAIDAAAGRGAEVVVLPEIWNSPYSSASFPEHAEDVGAGASPSWDMLSEAARRNGVVLVGGSIPEREAGRLYNTCFVFDAEGRQLGRHRKVHLFDIDIPGKIRFRESETLSPGQSLTVVDTHHGRLGVGICYDVRFPEMASLYAARGCHVLVYPGAFNLTTGPAHWELLMRSRAVDNQVYVAAVAPARDMSAGYHSWGHSMLVDPFGSVLAEAQEEETTLLVDVDLAAVEEQRRGIPYLTQKRPELYALLDLTAEDAER